MYLGMQFASAQTWLKDASNPISSIFAISCVADSDGPVTIACPSPSTSVTFTVATPPTPCSARVTAPVQLPQVMPPTASETERLDGPTKGWYKPLAASPLRHTQMSRQQPEHREPACAMPAMPVNVRANGLLAALC